MPLTEYSGFPLEEVVRSNGSFVVTIGVVLALICIPSAIGESQISQSDQLRTDTEMIGRLPAQANASAPPSKSPKARPKHASGEIIVKFKPGVSEEQIADMNARHGASVSYTSPHAGFKRLKIPENKTVSEMLEIYSKNPNVEYAELNYVAYTCWTPGDPLHPLQWHFDDSTYGGIHMQDAWELLGAPGTPGENVIVAVVDTGVAYEDNAAPAHWHIDSYNAYSGDSSWWCGVSTAPVSWLDPYKTPPGYGNGWKDYLQLKEAIDLTYAVAPLTLTYQYRHDLEVTHGVAYDKAYTEISTDGGATWTILRTYTGYTHKLGWELESVDLTSYITMGSSILLRFRFNSDDTYSDEDGYFNSDGAIFLDEIRLQDGSGTLFYDDAEAGTSAWETTQYEQAPDLAGTSFVAGYDFVNYDDHPNDDDGHGTHVTGTIAQSTGNGKGVAGMAFNCSIMPVKVLSSSGSGYYSWIADGIVWATDHGAQIINLSLGGSSPSTTLENAVAYAYNNGVTVVAASGNGGLGSVSYPAAYDAYVIAVGATQYDETRAPYSNYGSSLDVVAPGGNTLVNQNGDDYFDGVLQQTFGNTPTDWAYYFYQGTSMATPHVSGLAALLIGNGNATNPDDVRTALQDSADDLGSAGRDNVYGYGLINAYAALMYNTPVTEVYLQDWEGATLEEQLDGWYSKYEPAYGPEYDPIYIVNDPVAASGTWSQKVVRMDSASNYLSPLIPVTPGERYVVSTWINWVSGGWPFIGVSRYNASGSPMGLPLSDPYGDGAPRLIWLIGLDGYHTREGYDPIGDWVTPVPIVDEWQWYEKIFTVPEGTGYVRIMTELWKGAKRDEDPNLAYFDDIAMYAITPGSSYAASAGTAATEETSISMDLSIRVAGQNEFTRALATVAVIDSNGDPVEGATVYGSWSDAASDTVRGATDMEGKVTLESREVKNAPPEQHLSLP